MTKKKLSEDQKDQKEREIIRLEGEIDACVEVITYHKLNLRAVKDSKADYKDELRAVKQGKKYVPNKRRQSRWV